MKAVVVVEGLSDNSILRVILPTQMQRNVSIGIAGERGGLASTARTFLVTARKPLALLMDSDSLDARVIRERARTTEELLKAVSGPIPVKVIVVVPTIEIIFFEAEGLLDRLFPAELTPELRLAAQSDPKGVLKQLLGSERKLSWLLDQMTDEDIEHLRSTRAMSELLEFLSAVSVVATSA